jgi:hypothetical protein
MRCSDREQQPGPAANGAIGGEHMISYHPSKSGANTDVSFSRVDQFPYPCLHVGPMDIAVDSEAQAEMSLTVAHADERERQGADDCTIDELYHAYGLPATPSVP